MLFVPVDYNFLPNFGWKPELLMCGSVPDYLFPYLHVAGKEWEWLHETTST